MFSHFSFLPTWSKLQNWSSDLAKYRIDTCLVTKESADAVDPTHAVAAATAETTLEELSIPTPEYDLAILSAVVHISDDVFWMTSCGNWKGTSYYCPSFSDLKLTCTGKSPSETPFPTYFPTVVANLPALADLLIKFTNKKGPFVKWPSDHKIKFRHVHFEVSRPPSPVKPKFTNLIMNRSCLRQNQSHLCQKPHQTVTISNTKIFIIYI